MIVIDYAVAYKALNLYVDRFNAAVENAHQKLKTATVATAKEIIRIYGASLLTKAKQAMPDPAHLPPLRTNNRQLATLIKCSSRSVQRHIIKLKYAGVITEKVFHGTSADYTLWINPEILLIKPLNPVNNALQVLKTEIIAPPANPLKPLFFNDKQTNRRLPYTGNKKRNNNILIADKNDFSFRDPFSLNTGNISENKIENPAQINTETQNATKFSNSSFLAGNNSSAGGGSKLPVKTAGNALTGEELLIIDMKMFWFTARQALYKNIYITPGQEITAKKLIKHLYEQIPPALRAETHLMYIARIYLAAKYVAKEPGVRFIPLPFIYFDLKNPHGFVGTEKWYWAAMKRQGEIKEELLLERLIRRFLSNDELPILERLPRVKLYKESEKRLLALKDDRLLPRFYAAILIHWGLSEFIEDKSLIPA